jgi:sugar lactone lactonase YvrE
MKRAALLLLAAGIAACGRSTPPAENTSAPAPAPAPAANTAAPASNAVWTATDGIKTPESVYFDPASGFLFSSQIDGAPDGRDGNGRIVKLNRDGTLVNADFVTGLNAPKGLRACNGTLYTADLDEVIAVDVASGRVKSRTKITDAKFLNDVACAGDTAYVTDMLGNRIYAVKDGKPTVAADGDLEFPNGLLVDGDRLIVGGWGSQPKADFSTDTLGHLFVYDMKTKQKTLITQMPTANIDGLESDGKDGYIITDYLAGKILHVSATGETRLLRQLGPGAADIGFIPGSSLLLVPQMNDNRLVALDLSNDLK